MTYEQQNLAWQCLPSDAKKEVKQAFSMPTTNEYEQGYDNALVSLFGIHNLTSDADGEEMLYCDKSVVQSMAKSAIHSIQIHDYKGNTIASQNMATFNRGIMCALETLFGAKCLPDELTEDNFAKFESKQSEPKYKRGDNVMYDGTVQTIVSENIRCGREYYLSGVEYPVAESDLEPYTEPSEEESANTQPKSVEYFHLADEETHLRNYSRDMTNCDKSDCNRLQIAAMAMQGILSNTVLMKRYEDTTWTGKNPTQTVAYEALLYADTLIDKCRKGGTK